MQLRVAGNYWKVHMYRKVISEYARVCRIVCQLSELGARDRKLLEILQESLLKRTVAYLVLKSLRRAQRCNTLGWYCDPTNKYVRNLQSIINKRKLEQRQCGQCQVRSYEKMRYCGACRRQHYCSRRCQKKDWGQHKLKCGRVHGSVILCNYWDSHL